MGTIKNAVYKVDNGTDFDEIHFKTKAAQVFCNDGKTVESQLAEIVNGFANEKGNNGYTKLPNGIIIQWGEIVITVNKGTQATKILTLPTSFPNKAICGGANPIYDNTASSAPSAGGMIGIIQSSYGASSTRILLTDSGTSAVNLASGAHDISVVWWLLGY